MSMSMTGSLRCRTCSARFFLPASSSSSFLALCPRCLEVYLHDSPTPDLVLPPPPPPILPPPSTTEETMPSSDDLLPPPLPPWLVQGIPSQDPRSYRFMSSDSPPRPPIPPVWAWPSSSSSTSTPRNHLLGPSDPVADTGKEGPPSNMSVRQVCRESRVLSTQEQEEQHRSSSTSTAETTPAFQGLLPPPTLPWDDEYDFSSSDSDNQSPPRPPPPPPLYAYDPTFETLLQRGGSRAAPPPAFAYQAATFDTPLQRSRSQAAFAYQAATFDTPLQRGGSPEAPPPVSAYDATFDNPVQRGGSQAAPAASIAALPTVIVADAALVCPICTDPLPISAPARRLPCDHLYHSECIVTWLSLRNSCPVCRGSIPMFHSAATDIASPSTDPTPPAGRRRFLPGGRRIRRICSSLLRRMEISQDRQTNSNRDRQTDSSGDLRV
ncbi:hypothetical protein QYE76_005557 [Lolium multiflorum]|uniref:RING-type domain-containing protein n=1 Tax=Lolium multiflorum TaxID=4521 RepID=A0AAD8RV12_LOLMU|nr:hypothetical protein QYE76_005557 [Lolium multiflorum]